ncbi:MAG: metal ABC transporter ATP-binding protein [Candidatus Micrarchaeia archaeon]
MHEKIVEFENVTFSYAKHPAIKKASFSIEKGEFVGMIGPNGAGKTTIVKLMLGLIKPDFGTIKIFSKKMNEFGDWGKIGYVPQKATNFNQNFPASVFEVASMGRIQKAGLGKGLSKGDNDIVENALETAGILDLKDNRIGDLSGGQQQRVFIARALCAQPDLLILDEPTVGVDQKAQHEFYRLLEQLNKKGMTLVLISHDVGVVAKNAGKIMCVNTGVTVHSTTRGICKESNCECGEEHERRVPHHHD